MALAILAACSAQGHSPRAAAPASADLAGFVFAKAGGALIVARPPAPLTYSDGLPAKRAAMAHCATRRAALNPAALGRFTAEGWQFDGGCI